MEWQGRPYLCLIDLQQHRPCSEAAVIEQHVGQDGQLGGGALQGSGVSPQGLLWGGGSPSQRDRVREREKKGIRQEERGTHPHRRCRGRQPGRGMVRRKQERERSGEDPQPGLDTPLTWHMGLQEGPWLSRTKLRTEDGPLDLSEDSHCHHSDPTPDPPAPMTWVQDLSCLSPTLPAHFQVSLGPPWRPQAGSPQTRAF